MIGTANAEVLWEDNFNGFTSGWTPSVSGNVATFYPWTTDETYNPEDPADDGGGTGISDYEPSVYADGQRKNSNSWNGWVQYAETTGAISIQTTGGASNSPVLRFRLVKHTGLSNETGLHKWLGNVDHQALYIQYKVKFGTSGEDFWWNGSWTDGGPVDGGNLGIIWKFGRVWTGFNPTDYDKTGGQTQPVENTTWTDESNWRSGIWIFRWMAQNPTDTVIDNSTYFDVSNFYASVDCTSPLSCDSQSPSRDPDTGNQWDWLSSLPGHTKTIFNGGNPLDNDGTFSQAQTFHTVEMYFKNRTNPSTADGDMRIWIDGTEITESATVSPPILASMSADADDYGMNFIRFGDNFNNLTLNIPDSPGYMDVFIDDIVISTTYIGTDYVIGEGETPAAGGGKMGSSAGCSMR